MPLYEYVKPKTGLLTG